MHVSKNKSRWQADVNPSYSPFISSFRSKAQRANFKLILLQLSLQMLQNNLHAMKTPCTSKRRKMKSRLILKALVLPCSSTEEEAMSMKHAIEELTPSSPSGQPSYHAICPPPKKELSFRAMERRTPHLSRGGASHPEHGSTLTDLVPRGRTRALPPSHVATHIHHRSPQNHNSQDPNCLKKMSTKLRRKKRAVISQV
jgi:hypothetical protein